MSRRSPGWVARAAPRIEQHSWIVSVAHSTVHEVIVWRRPLAGIAPEIERRDFGVRLHGALIEGAIEAALPVRRGKGWHPLDPLADAVLRLFGVMCVEMLGLEGSVRRSVESEGCEVRLMGPPERKRVQRAPRPGSVHAPDAGTVFRRSAKAPGAALPALPPGWPKPQPPRWWPAEEGGAL